ncbi:MAG: hypothetical protein SFV23_16580 [Planctomycetaceae bacterium]|nr:hypothetical protein [Planctomycetaceae bacterium]
MPKTVCCDCGEVWNIEDSYAEATIPCPGCGANIPVDPTTADIPDESLQQAATAEKPAEPPVPLWLRMLLDPQTIQRLVFGGGGLAVLGLIAWLVSLGVFDDPLTLAVAMGAGTAALLASGWGVTLRTRYRLAGQSLTFLACVVAPLNLWFYDAQGLVTMDGHLWIGGLICSLAYLTTMYVLRDPVFLYAVEAGVTLTMLLLLGNLQRVTDSASVCATLLTLGAVSIHLERAFAADHPVFSRRRFGLPVFFSGQAQLAGATLSLLTLQVVHWLWSPVHAEHWGFSRLVNTPWLAATLWLAAAYMWFYSGLVVRQLGIYSYLAAVALIFAQITWLQDVLSIDGLIAVLALTSFAVRVLVRFQNDTDRRWSTISESLSLGIALAPMGMAVYRHLAQNHSETLPTMPLDFTGALAVVTTSLFASGAFCRRDATRSRSAFWSFGSVALWLTGLHSLELLGVSGLARTTPILLAIPLLTACVLAFAHRRTWAADLLNAAVAMTVGGLGFTLLAADAATAITDLVSSQGRNVTTLLAAILCAELTAFFLIAATLQPRRWPLQIVGGLWGLAAAWKFVLLMDLSEAYYAPLLALLGVVLSLIGRLRTPVAMPGREQSSNVSAWSSAGDIVLVLAELSAFLRGLARFAGPLSILNGGLIATVAVTAGLAYLGALLATTSSTRRWHSVAATCVSLVALASCIRLWDLRDYQKVELAAAVIGGLMVIAGYVGRLRETARERSFEVSAALFVGSLLATIPLLACTLGGRWFTPNISLFDEFLLTTACLLLLASGCIFQIRATTAFGGGSLALYLITLFAHLAYRPQIAMGVYLAAGGLLVFLFGVLLSMYRDRLLALPSKIANREGVFRVIDWR